jgi:hypothetical protein
MPEELDRGMIRRRIRVTQMVEGYTIEQGDNMLVFGPSHPRILNFSDRTRMSPKVAYLPRNWIVV